MVRRAISNLPQRQRCHSNGTRQGWVVPSTAPLRHQRIHVGKQHPRAQLGGPMDVPTVVSWAVLDIPQWGPTGGSEQR